ncbi:MAG: hypothetical protein JST59_00215 [Actinobacteria bacterium]|nr:hypothetical protein [Actinomycetota bacterium]
MERPKGSNEEVSPFLLRKQLEEKDREIERIRNENANLMEVIDRLSKQSLPGIVKTESMNKLERLEAENKSLKEKLVEKEIALGDF